MGPRIGRIEEFAEYRRLASIDEIGRRCFANNAFDGILTIIGVLMGSYVARVQEPYIIVSTGLATCMAMGVSGFWGAYMTESAERKHAMRKLEKALLRDLAETKQARASRFAVVVVSLIDGLSPLIAGGVVLLPFLLTGLLGGMQVSYIASLVTAMLLLFGLGAFLASVAKESILRSGVRMIAAGITCILLSLILNVKS